MDADRKAGTPPFVAAKGSGMGKNLKTTKPRIVHRIVLWGIKCYDLFHLTIEEQQNNEQTFSQRCWPELGAYYFYCDSRGYSGIFYGSGLPSDSAIMYIQTKTDTPDYIYLIWASVLVRQQFATNEEPQDLDCVLF